MKVTQDKIENRQAYLTIEMEPAEVEEGLKKAYNRLVKKYNIPGFRKGKTPRSILEQYLGKEAFLEEAVEVMAPEAYEKAVKEQDLKAIYRPGVSLESMEPVIYKMTVPLEPTIKLGDYKAIRIEEEAVELKEEDVEKTIGQIRKQYATWDAVDREAAEGDAVTIDIESKVGDQPYINQKDAPYEVEKESEFPMKGFSEELVGMKKDETKEFKLSFPEDYGREEFAGKEAEFKVTLKEVKQSALPEFDDELAKKADPSSQTAEELKEKIRTTLKNSLEQTAKNNYEAKAVEALIACSEMEYPEIMVEEEIDNLVKMQMQRWGMDEAGLKQYLESLKKTVEDFRGELKTVAEKNVKQTLALSELAKSEDIKISNNDLNNELMAMARNYTGDQQKKMIELLSIPQNQMNVASNIAFKKALGRMVALAQGKSEEEIKAEEEKAAGIVEGEYKEAAPEAAAEGEEITEAKEEETKE